MRERVGQGRPGMPCNRPSGVCWISNPALGVPAGSSRLKRPSPAGKTRKTGPQDRLGINPEAAADLWGEVELRRLHGLGCWASVKATRLSAATAHSRS